MSCGCSRAECRCKFAPSDCVAVSGDGARARPYAFSIPLSEDPANALRIADDGLLLPTPTSLSRRPHAKALGTNFFDVEILDSGEGDSFLRPLPFDTTVTDNSGIWESSAPTRLTFARDGYWRFGTRFSVFVAAFDGEDDPNELELIYGSSGTATGFKAYVVKNGVEKIAPVTNDDVGILSFRTWGHHAVSGNEFEAGDYIEVLWNDGTSDNVPHTYRFEPDRVFWATHVSD